MVYFGPIELETEIVATYTPVIVTTNRHRDIDTCTDSRQKVTQVPLSFTRSTSVSSYLSSVTLESSDHSHSGLSLTKVILYILSPKLESDTCNRLKIRFWILIKNRAKWYTLPSISPWLPCLWPYSCTCITYFMRYLARSRQSALIRINLGWWLYVSFFQFPYRRYLLKYKEIQYVNLFKLSKHFEYSHFKPYSFIQLVSKIEKVPRGRKDTASLVKLVSTIGA